MLGVFQASAAASSARHYGVLVARNLLSFEYPPSAGRSLLPGLYLPFCSVCVAGGLFCPCDASSFAA